MAVIDSLTTAKAQIAANLAAITLNPKPTYSVDGQSVSWSEYHAMLAEQMARINDLIQVEGGPFENRSQATS